MSISLEKALYNVNKLYNKPEMFQYIFTVALFPFVIFAILGGTGSAVLSQIMSGNTGQEQAVNIIISFLGIFLIVFIVSVIFSIFINGIYIMALHNAISCKEKIFPSIISEFFPVFKTGALFFACTVLFSIGFSIVNQVVLGTLSVISAALFGGNDVAIVTISVILASAIYLIQALFMWLMMISFSRKTEFSQYFDFKWCLELLTKKVKELTMLGVYDILLFIPIVIVFCAFASFGFPVVQNIQAGNSEQLVPLILFGAIVMSVITVYYYYIQIINIDLIAQITGKHNEEI